METDNNIQELRLKIQRRLRFSQIVNIVGSIIIIGFLWSIITGFHDRSTFRAIIDILLVLFWTDSSWSHYKKLKKAKEDLQSDDPTLLEECYKRVNSDYKTYILSFTITAIIVGSIVFFLMIGLTVGAENGKSHVFF